MRVVFAARIFFWRCISINEILINDEIREKEVRVISAEGEQLGIMSSRDAYNMAQEKLSLIHISEPTRRS